MQTAKEILKKIEQDKETAEKYLLSGERNKTKFSRAVVMLENELSPIGVCLLESRRELEKSRKYKSGRHWVIKTQFIYNKLAEQRGLECVWLSESKIKRQWQAYVNIISEMAIRLDKEK